MIRLRIDRDAEQESGLVWLEPGEGGDIKWRVIIEEWDQVNCPIEEIYYPVEVIDDK